jgi:hypothetical protein
MKQVMRIQCKLLVLRLCSLLRLNRAAATAAVVQVVLVIVGGAACCERCRQHDERDASGVGCGVAGGVGHIRRPTTNPMVDRVGGCGTPLGCRVLLRSGTGC